MKKKLSTLLLPTYFASWILYFFWFWSKALFFNEAGGLSAGHVNIWGDWAAHLTMTTSMIEKGLTLESPFLIGARFSYPFAINFISAVLNQLGIPLIPAMILPSLFFSIAVVFALYWFYLVLFKSKSIAVVSSLIFLLGGGIGFYYWAQDVLKSPQPLEQILSPDHEYTRIDSEQIKWINVVDSMIIPQRAFVMGFPLGLVALALIYSVLDEKKKSLSKKKQYTYLGVAGVIIGFMPIIHTHTLLAIFIILGWWTLLKLWHLLESSKNKSISKNLKTLNQVLTPFAIVLTVSSLIAAPLIRTFFLSHVDGGFLIWHPGWLAADYKINWFLFWFKNWGITPALAIFGWLILFFRKDKKDFLFRSLIPFFFIFAVSNLFLFQPFAWDNTKLIVWSAVGIAGLSGYLLVTAWNQNGKLLKALVTLIFLVVNLSGFLDIYRIARHDLHSYQMYSAEELSLANFVEEHTNEDSIWLTGDQHNHWLFNLTGRQAVMTYRGWLWTHGYSYQSTERDVITMFNNPTDNKSLFEKYDISYIVIGPNEKNVWKAKEADFEENFGQIFQTENFTIYQVEN